MYTWSPDTGDWLELGRTEEIRDSLHPKWRTTFLVPYIPDRKLRIVVYDIDVHSNDLERQDVIGEAVYSIADVHDAPRHMLSRRLTYLPRPSSIRGSLVAVGVTIEEDHELTSIERLAILKRLADALADGKPGNSFSGEAAVKFLATEVLSFKDDTPGARDELDLFLRIGYLSPTVDIEGKAVSKPDAYNPVSSRIVFAPEKEYTVNGYFLETQFSKNVLEPSSAAMAEAERSMHAQRLVFVDEVSREYFLPDELRDSQYIRFGKLTPARSVPPVIAATLPKLVEHVTYAKAPDMDLLHAVILTYESYTTAHNLLDVFMSRFASGGTLPHETEADAVMVKFRVLNALKLWVNTRFTDFYDDVELRETLVRFAKGIVAFSENPPLSKLAAAVVGVYDKKTAGIDDPDASDYVRSGHFRDDSPPPPLVAADFSSVSSLFDLDPEEVARQLTLMEHGAYCQIRLTELMGCAWSKSDKEEKSANLLAAISQFNAISCLFRDAVVSEPDVEVRADIIEFALLVAEQCAALNNISSVMAIVASLSSTPIHRLKKTWSVLNSNKRISRLRDELENLISNESNFKTYRKFLNKVDPPAVPYLGMWLSDLTFLEDGNADETQDGLINFAKYDLIARVLADVSQFQLMRYQLVPVDIIQSYIRNKLESALDEEEAYRRSLAVEPRNRPTPDINQLADENAKLKDTIRSLNRKVASLEASSQRMEDEMSSLASVVAQIRVQMAEMAKADEPPAGPAGGTSPGVVPVVVGASQGGESGGEDDDNENNGSEEGGPGGSDVSFLRLAGEHHNRASQAILISELDPSPTGGDAPPSSSSGASSSSTPAGDAPRTERTESTASASAKRKPVAHSGFLKKQSGSKASKWQKRWIVLRDGHVSYYKNQKDSKPAGVIVLHGCIIRECTKEFCGQDHAFEIFHEQRRVYRFYAQDDVERATWIGVLDSQTE